jgi:hypothetical protein
MDELNAERNWVEAAWVYAWFPVFNDARRMSIVEHHITSNASLQLPAAYERASVWVYEQLQNGTYRLPRNFRVPLAYSDPDHPDLAKLANVESEFGITLDHKFVPTALFLARGLFYQGVAYQQAHWSYLPHSFRSILLSDVEQQAASIISAATTSMEAAQVLRELDSAFLRRVGALVNLPTTTPSIAAIGGGFLRTSESPLAAMRHAMEFRETGAGREVRDRFRELVRLAQTGAHPLLQLHLSEIDRQLRDYLLHKFGYTDSPANTTQVFLSLLGSCKTALIAALEILPSDVRTGIMRFLYTPLTPPSGFQLLFSHYLEPPAQRWRWSRR